MSAGADPTPTAWRQRTLGTAFEVLYHNRALYWLASTIPFAGQWRHWQRRVLPRLQGRDVLEVGCGLGTLLADMLAAGYGCRAVDASPEMVAAARARLRRRGVPHPEDVVCQARVQQLPFPDASFDAVVSTFPTPYIYDVSALTEIARVLRPGGCLIIVAGASLLPANALLRPFVLFQSLAYGQSAPVPSALEVGGQARDRRSVHTLPVTPRRTTIPLERAGLVPHEEADVARWWVVFIVVGEKPHVP
jgi:ubiquinone/menaquinone biosynthesis C-methylase UbiE